jgi:hypothetical protein
MTGCSAAAAFRIASDNGRAAAETIRRAMMAAVSVWKAGGAANPNQPLGQPPGALCSRGFPTTRRCRHPLHVGCVPPMFPGADPGNHLMRDLKPSGDLPLRKTGADQRDDHPRIDIIQLPRLGIFSAGP